MSNWKYKTERKGEQVDLVATPNTENLSASIFHAAQELTRKLVEHEEKLIVECVSTEALLRLRSAIQIELAQRAALSPITKDEGEK